jgi:hypothetical protein
MVCLYKYLPAAGSTETRNRAFYASGDALQLDDPEIFPHQYGVPFPANFMAVVKVIFKRLFRVYAHIYHSHFKHVCSLDAEAHLNSCFKHFIAFAQARLLDFLVNKNVQFLSSCQG